MNIDLASSHWVHSLCLGNFVCVRLFSCIISACMLYYCNTARWAWLDWGLSGWLTTLLQCFDTVGSVIRPVKTVGRITYIVLVQTLNHAQSTTSTIRCVELSVGLLFSEHLKADVQPRKNNVAVLWNKMYIHCYFVYKHPVKSYSNSVVF